MMISSFYSEIDINMLRSPKFIRLPFRKNSTKKPKSNEKKPEPNFYSSFNDSVNKISTFLSTARQQITNENLNVTKNKIAIAKKLDNPDNFINHPNSTFNNLKNTISNVVKQYNQNTLKSPEVQSLDQYRFGQTVSSGGRFERLINEKELLQEQKKQEQEKLDEINEERFYQRVALSNHTQKLIKQLQEQLEVIQKLPNVPLPVIEDESFNEMEVNKDVLQIIEKLEELARLMTNQPESILMAFRFDADKLILAIDQQLKRLIQPPHMRSNSLNFDQNLFNQAFSLSLASHPYITSRRATKICQILMGDVGKPKGKDGIRILCLDGGGTRGILTIEILRNLQNVSGGRPIHTLFDYICGVSTGAILAMMIGVQKRPLDEIEEIYRNLSSQIFSTSILQGSLGFIQNHSYHDTDKYEKILQDIFDETMLLEAAIDPNCPKISAVSCLSNRPRPKAFLWRNYNLIYGQKMEQIFPPGTINAPIWKAVRASSAAPGYFRELQTQMINKVRISPTSVDIHCDGGLLNNNPSFIATQECKALWPDHKIQSLVSIGTGRFQPTIGPSGKGMSTSLMDKFNMLVDSATNVDSVHKTMYSHLENGTYFRFNPYTSNDLGLDVYEKESLDLLKNDAVEYFKRNPVKFGKAVDSLER